MSEEDKLRSLYIDLPDWKEINVDDFLVAIGLKQSNSVYHIAEVKSIVPKKNIRARRFYLRVYKSDLLTALRRDDDQELIPIQWYRREKKNN